MAKRRENVVLFPGVEALPRLDHLEAVQDAFGQELDTLVIIGTHKNGETYVNVPMGLTLAQARSIWAASLRYLEETEKPKGRGGRGGKKT